MSDDLCNTCGERPAIEPRVPWGKKECKQCRRKTGNCKRCGANRNDCCC